MPMKTWKASIRLGRDNTVAVQVQANTEYDAKKLLEAQYGKGKIVNNMVRPA